jgi:hypothetical protein
MMADSMRPSRQAILLFFGLLFVYNINLRQVSSHDTYASRFVPISILRDGDLILDEFVPETIKHQAGDQFFSDYFHYTRGHFYDSHPPVGPLLALPVYALPAWIGIPARAELVANLFSKLAASIIAALSAIVLFAAAKRLVSDDGGRIALLAAVAYALGTSIWSTASQAMWTHTPAVLGYAVALWALAAGRPSLAGISAVAAAFARPATLPVVALLGLYVIHISLVSAGLMNGTRPAHAGRAPQSRPGMNDVLRFCGAGLVTGAAGLLYNTWMFGNFVGGAPFRTSIWMEEFGTTDMFSGSLPLGLGGLTVSPSRGLLIFSPIVIVAIAGAVKAWRSSPASDGVLLARYSSVAAVAILLIYAKFIAWWGGHGFGPRYLTDAMPFVGLLLAFGFTTVIENIRRVRILRLAVALLLGYSICIQAIGAFCWPSQWTLNNTPPYRFRLWDWRDTEIATCIREGPKIDPAARHLMNRLGL